MRKLFEYKKDNNDLSLVKSIKIIYYIKYINFLITTKKSMVEKTKKTVQARAKIAHKLAKYVRAAPVHLPTGSSPSQPSVTHLSILLVYHSLGWCPSKKIKK